MDEKNASNSGENIYRTPNWNISLLPDMTQSRRVMFLSDNGYQRSEDVHLRDISFAIPMIPVAYEMQCDNKSFDDRIHCDHIIFERKGSGLFEEKSFHQKIHSPQLWSESEAPSSKMRAKWYQPT